MDAGAYEVLIESDWNLKYTSGMKSYMLYRY